MAEKKSKAKVQATETCSKLLPAAQLAEFLKHAVSPFQTVEESKKLLLKAGYTELMMAEDWKLKQGQGYFCIPEGKELVAFTMGKGSRMHIAAAHTDFPCLHVKPKAELMSGGYMRVNTEVYGGPILNTWLDRPLSMAGRVVLRSKKVYEPRTVLVDIGRPVLTIPNLAVHYNREVNKGFELKKQNDMLPLIGMIDDSLNKDSFFLDFVAAEIGEKKEDILDFDFYIYNAEDPAFTGIRGDMLSAPRLDNITSCFALVKGLIKAGGKGEGLNLIALFDNEEIGSRTRQGADSAMLKTILTRIYAATGRDSLELEKDITQGFLLSVDVAHATHPAHGEKYDPVNNMRMNDGITLKLSANQRYTYDSIAVAAIQQLCEKNGIKYKKFVNNADMPGGGTLGPIISGWLPMMTVDTGVPILAMHSARELMGAEDQADLEKLLTEFYK